MIRPALLRPRKAMVRASALSKELGLLVGPVIPHYLQSHTYLSVWFLRQFQLERPFLKSQSFIFDGNSSKIVIALVMMGLVTALVTLAV